MSESTPAPSAHLARGRVLTAVVILVAFIVSMTLQNVTQARHRELVANTGSEAKVSNIDSFSLALLLGGLRGPLVMMLWTSSENQKQDKDLEDFDSKIELIRLLQPEFDSVHIFQMWNKAYNISVQMANKANKYATIVDALEYGYKVDRQHPLDINIVDQIGRLFFEKLGNSQEQQYYSDRVRRETFPDMRVTLRADQADALESGLTQAGIDPARRGTLAAQAKRNGSIIIDKLTADVLRRTLQGPGVKFEEVDHTQVFSDTGRRIRLDPILNLDGTLRADAAGPVGAKPDSPFDLPALAYLRQFEPFPYGVGPMAIGNAYYKRTQLIKDILHQKHLQVSDLVVDNRPAINAENWSNNEWGAGRYAEMHAFGVEIPRSSNYADEREKIELPTAPFPPTAIPDAADAQKAIYHYELAVKISKLALVEFKRHAGNYPAAAGQFRNHRQQIEANAVLCEADAAYLKATLLPPGDPARQPLLDTAAKLYRTTMLLNEAYSFEHATPEEMLIPPIIPKGQAPQDFIEKLYLQSAAAPPQTITPLDQVVSQFGGYLDANPRFDAHNSERVEAQRYISRALQRLIQLHAAPR